MEDDNTHLKFSNKHKILNFNLTLVKNKVHSANLFNSLLNIEDLSEPKKNPRKIALLFTCQENKHKRQIK